MRNLIITTVALSALAAATPAFAGHNHNGGPQGGPQAYGSVDPRCASDRRTARNVGGFLGALGGASAGRALAAAAVRPEGVILGTVVGAVVGSSLGNASVDCTPRPLYTQQRGRSYGASGHDYGNQAAYVQAPTGPAPVYYSQAPVYQPEGDSQLGLPDRRAYSYQASAPQPVYQAPVYQPPVQYQAPVYQPPVYQQPVYQQPIHHQPAHHQGGQHHSGHQQSHQVVVGEDWYQPSPQSYYGQERRGPLVAAPSAYGRPDLVPQDSYVGSVQQSQSVVVTQSYHAGGPVVMAPPGAPCGYHVCR